MRKRVVVTGAGMVTPLGIGREITWRNLIAGKSGIDRITLFDASSFPTKIAGEVKGFNFAKAFADEVPWMDKFGRNIQFALAASKEAYEDAGLANGDLVPERFGVYLGGGIPPKIRSAIVNGPFQEAFTRKGRFTSMLEKTAVKIVMNDRAALLGAAISAIDA